MRSLRFPSTVTWLVLALTAAVSLVACSDDGGGTTPHTPTIGVSLGSATLGLTQGQNNTVTVNVTRGGGYNGAVDLSLEGTPAGVSGTFAPASVPAGSTSSTLTLDATLGAAVGAHNLTVRASGQGAQEQTAALALTVAEAPSISITVEPAMLSIEQAASGDVVVTIARTNFPGAVDLSFENAPEGVTGTFAPASVPSGANEGTLSLAIGEDAPAGDHQLVVRASGEGVEDATETLGLTIAEPSPYTITLDPSSLSIAQGGSGTAQIEITRTTYFGTIVLVVGGRHGTGTPSGVAASVSPSSVTGNAATLTVDVGADAPAGTYSLTINSHDGTREGERALAGPSATLQLTVTEVDGYKMTVDPASLNLPQGESGTVGIQLARSNFPGAIALSVSGMPSGVSADISPSSTTGDSATLSVSVDAAAAAGTYPLTVTGQAPGLEDRTATLQLTVTQAVGFSLNVSPASLTVPQALKGTAELTAVGAAGFLSPVELSVTGVASVTGGVLPNVIDLRRPNAATLLVFVDADAAPGVYPVTIHGTEQQTSGPPHRDSVTIMVTVQARPTSTEWAQASVGDDHSCALTAAGEAYCWGGNSNGQLGTGNRTSQGQPTRVAGTQTWAMVSAGGHFTCGVTTTGEAYCWGSGVSGRLGNGTALRRLTPERVSGDQNWASISAGAQHACGISTGGEAFCWGANWNGGLGDGTTTQRLVPVAVAGDLTWKSVVAGDQHTCGVTTAGEAYCWGYNQYGQLGNGTTTHQYTPTAVLGSRTWAHVSTGRYYTCGMTSAGEVYCWGRNEAGQLGTGSSGSNETSPLLVSGGLTWMQVDAGYQSTCGLTTSGEAFCWGNGPLGNGSTNTSAVPMQVLGYTWESISAGRGSTCGRGKAGNAYCWGSRVGDGSTGNSPTPVWLSDPQ